MRIGVKQHLEKVDEGWFRWSVELVGPPEELDRIRLVTYTLDPSFPQPVRRITDRSTNFRLSAEGRGTFPIHITLLRRDDKAEEHLTHELAQEDIPASSRLSARISAPGQKKILALDGGGVRSVITLEVLAAVEGYLRSVQSRSMHDTFVLADYFDFVAGTSSGAILAACVSLGMPVSKIREFFIHTSNDMFDKASLLKQFRYKYTDEKLAKMLKEEFGAGTALGDAKLRTLLMMVMRNATNDAPWPVWNNPSSKYNSPDRLDSNLRLPLWQLVRASTAGPVLFPPEVISVGGSEYVVVGGDITPYYNPAFQAFIMSTTAPYCLNWACGESDLLLVSIGSGKLSQANRDLGPDEMNLVYNASSIPSALMSAARNEQDLLCRVFGKCVAGDVLDREVGHMMGQTGPISPKLFTYMRYEADLSAQGLYDLGLSGIGPEDVQRPDSVEHIDELQKIGQAIAKFKVSPSHFQDFV